MVPDLRPETDPSSQEEEEEETECSETPPWTRLDWAIILVKCLVWVCIQVIFIKIEFGAVFFLVSAILLMTSNLGKRKAGEASAYSVFNENCEEIAGTFSGEKFDKQLRRGGGVM